MIAPGDSFVASFTPPRSGTFIYHAHSNETFQINLGLYGGLLVVDSTGYDPARERLIILGAQGPGGQIGARINGRLDAGHASPDGGRTLSAAASFTSCPTGPLRIALVRDDSIVHWRALAKDGAELPARLPDDAAASLLAGPGETMDFEYQPTSPGLMRLDVEQRTGEWKTHLPITVEARRVH